MAESLKPRATVVTTDPSLPASAPYRDKSYHEKEPPKRNFFSACYNREKKEYCGRPCKSWLAIISYGIIYLIFLSTFTLFMLYVSLIIVKKVVKFDYLDPAPFSYSEGGIGLTATPTSEGSYPLIWYKLGESDDYEKYVLAIDKLLAKNRKKRDLGHLGPCGQSPYGYGENPCVILRINKNFHWAGKPLKSNSTLVQKLSSQVKKWVVKDKNRLWVQCYGYHSYDKEHIGNISYYPDPPGFDPGIFPLLGDSLSPLIALQISNFTLGVSLAIECKLWYEDGPSTTNFVLFVAPDDNSAPNG